MKVLYNEKRKTYGCLYDDEVCDSSLPRIYAATATKLVLSQLYPGIKLDDWEFIDVEVVHTPKSVMPIRYPHDMFCNANPFKPIGGDMCSCISRIEAPITNSVSTINPTY